MFIGVYVVGLVRLGVSVFDCVGFLLFCGFALAVCFDLLCSWCICLLFSFVCVFSFVYFTCFRLFCVCDCGCLFLVFGFFVFDFALRLCCDWCLLCDLWCSGL